MKATGDGLQLRPDDIVVSAAIRPPRLLSCSTLDAPEEVSLFDLPVEPDYVASLAVLGECRGVRAHDGSRLLATHV